MPTPAQTLTWDSKTQENIVLTLSIVSIIFGLYQVWCVMSIKVGKSSIYNAGDEEMQDIKANDSAN